MYTPSLAAPKRIYGASLAQQRGLGSDTASVGPADAREPARGAYNFTPFRTVSMRRLVSDRKYSMLHVGKPV